MRITSLHNPRVKAAVRLRDRSGRDEQRRIIIDGLREISRALQTGVEILEIYYVPQRCISDAHQQLLASAQASRIELHEVTEPLMEKLAFGHRHEGFVAVATPPRRTLQDLARTCEVPANDVPTYDVPANAPLIAIVEGAEKPGNLGAILRTADAAGLSAVIVASGGTDLYNPNAIRASLGAIFTTPVCEATTEETIAWLRQWQFRILAARVDAATVYTAADLRRRAAIVLGSEAHGLSHHWHAADITPIRLPMLGSVDSLNLSATAAILFYEALRQRQPTTQRSAFEP